MVRSFTRQAYQVESPSPLYKERMQPRDNEVETSASLEERIRNWIEENVPKEYPTHEGKMGRCAAYAAALVKNFGGILIRGMNTKLKPGDTCHFWAEIDGREYDPTGHWYPGGSNYDGKPVSLEKNLDYFETDPVFKKLAAHGKLNSTRETSLKGFTLDIASGKRLLANAQYEYGITDIITGEMLVFDSLQKALYYAINRMGWSKEKAPEAIHIRVSGEGWELLTEKFGTLDFSSVTDEIEEWKPPTEEQLDEWGILRLPLDPAAKEAKEKAKEELAWTKEGEEWKRDTNLDRKDWREEGEEWKTATLRGFTREAESQINEKDNPYCVNPCPACGEYASGSYRHIGAPVYCPNRHHWFPGTSMVFTEDEYHSSPERALYEEAQRHVKAFTHREAARWTPKELDILKQVYRTARDRGIPHNMIYRRLSDFIPRSYRGIKQKLESLYKQDEALKGYKFESWDRDRIIQELVDLYRKGEPIARKSLPVKLEYQITNHSLPKAITRGFEVFFDSFDHAIAEAIMNIGCERDSEGNLLTDQLIDDPQEAWYYYRTREKKNNPWTKAEIVRLFKKAHEKGLPLTKSFFTSHPEVYKPLIGVSRSLDGLRKSVDRLGHTWGDIVIEAVPDYESWYNENGKPKNSMGELRVIRFLDLQGIPYRPATRNDKIAVTEPEVLEAGYRNFIPDIFILDENGNDIGIVEIYGAIADSGAAAGELQQKYREKIEAKERVYNSLPIDYIAIHDNSLSGCDLSDDRLIEKFSKFIKPEYSSIDEL